MPRIVGRLFAATLLTLCVGVHVLEVSGRWDQTFQDANDEAGIVAVVFCVGAALFAAGTLLSRLRQSRTVAGVICADGVLVIYNNLQITPPISTSSPPISLRV